MSTRVPIFVMLFSVLTISCILGQTDLAKSKLANGLSYKNFSYHLLLNKDYVSDEFDFTEEQTKKLRKMEAELQNFSGIEKTDPITLFRPKRNLKEELEKDYKKTDQQLLQSGSLRTKSEESYQHYLRARKILAPHQLKRFEQIMAWSDRTQKNTRFTAWSDREIHGHWELDRKQMQSLIEFVGQAERQYQKQVSEFREKQLRKIFGVLTEQQKKKYLDLIDPKREITQCNSADFDPFSIMTPGKSQIRKEARLTGEQYFRLAKIRQEFGKRLKKIKSELSKQEREHADHDIIRHELLKKEFSTKLKKLFTPEQLATIERHYLKDHLSYHGPVQSIFDPAIAARSGISMQKLKSMKQLRAKLAKDEKQKRIELTRAGFKSILKKTSKEIRGKIDKYFGEPPLFVLNRK